MIDSRGFTFVEFVVVLGLAGFLFSLAIPFTATLMTRHAFLSTLIRMKDDVRQVRAYALSGKSFSSLVAGRLTDAALLPSYHALFFFSQPDVRDSYFYTEWRPHAPSSSADLLYSAERFFPSDRVRLQEVRLFSADALAPPLSVPAAALFFSSPAGEAFFIPVFVSVLPASFVLPQYSAYTRAEFIFAKSDDPILTESLSLKAGPDLFTE